MEGLIVVGVLVLFALFLAARTIRIIPQAKAGVVERLGRYQRTLDPGLAIVIPFVDRVKPLIDLREQVVSFRPQAVITKDNVTVSIDTVLYFTITDAASVTYEVANPLQAIEQLTVTTLRNVIGSLTLEETLTSRDQINMQLRAVLDEATGRWGIRVNRVELKAVDPPATIQEAMEKQMRAERDRRAAILHGRGRQGSRRSSPPRARSSRACCAPRAPRRRRSCRPRARRRRSRPSSRPSTTASPTRSCSATSTCRCSRSSRRGGEQAVHHPERGDVGAREPLHEARAPAAAGDRGTTGPGPGQRPSAAPLTSTPRRTPLRPTPTCSGSRRRPASRSTARGCSAGRWSAGCWRRSSSSSSRA
jgi:regulator of protease activity HflC (stomatin/prohibitin superfamily)